VIGMAIDFIADITPLWRKLDFLERLTLEVSRMIPTRINKDEPKVDVDPTTKQRIEDEIRALHFERFDVEKAITATVLEHRGWIVGKCFSIRHDKRWHFDQRELCKILSVDGKGRARIVKAWKGKPAWADDDEFSAYAGPSWDFHNAMDECDPVEFDVLVAGIRSMLPGMIPESHHVDTTIECSVIGGLISKSMKVLDFKDLNPTFEIMNETEQFIIGNIDKFSGRCYEDDAGSLHAIIGTGWDNAFKKKYIKSISVDMPLVESICGFSSRMIDITSFKITPFTRVRQIPRATFLDTAFSIISA
jgi:hypothetical protein